MDHYNATSFEEERHASIVPKPTPPNETSAFAFSLTDCINEEGEAGAYQYEVPIWQDHAYVGLARTEENGKTFAYVHDVILTLTIEATWKR
jgi:hypothetical protein